MSQSPNDAEEQWFGTALVYARKIKLHPKLISFTNVHRGSMAKLDYGFFIIEEAWFPKNK